jgi:AraC family transcriptional regulator of adaptative response/methylated-DNA-[protein]-cysteine methyltransferase
MNLMISDAAWNATPVATRADDAVEIVSYGIGECALGKMLIARSASGVCAILLGDDREELETDLAARLPRARLVANRASVDDDLATVTRFVDQPGEGFHLPLDMRGTPFQRRIWEKLRAIPVGRTVSYSELARWVGPFTSPRAVASACAANPIAIAVPCHRAVRSDGELAGYRWGIARKRNLIRREATAGAGAGSAIPAPFAVCDAKARGGIAKE